MAMLGNLSQIVSAKTGSKMSLLPYPFVSEGVRGNFTKTCIFAPYRELWFSAGFPLCQPVSVSVPETFCKYFGSSQELTSTTWQQSNSDVLLPETVKLLKKQNNPFPSYQPPRGWECAGGCCPSPSHPWGNHWRDEKHSCILSQSKTDTRHSSPTSLSSIWGLFN